MARSSINKSAIRKLQRDLQKAVDRAGPVRIPLEADPSSISGASTGVPELNVDLATIRILEWMFDHDGESEVLNLTECLSVNGIDSDRGRLLIGRLDSSGDVDELRAFGGPPSARLTSRGAARVEEVRSNRKNLALRVSELRSQMLRWLFEVEEMGDSPASWDEFVAQRRSHLAGDVFTEDEVRRQASYLAERSLITATAIEEESAGYLNPILTVAGRDCVTDYNGNVGDYMRRHGDAGGVRNYGPVFNGDFTSSQVAWNNENVAQAQQITQNQQVAAGFEDVARVLSEVLRRLDEFQLGDDDRRDAEQATNEILAEVVEQEPDRGRFRRAAQQLKGLLAPIFLQATTGVGEGVHELAKQAIESLGNAPI